MYKLSLEKIIENEMNEYLDGAYSDYGSAKSQVGSLTQAAYKAGYSESLNHLQLLSDALDALRDFASSVGGSSSFWEECWSEFDDDVFEVQMKIVRELSAYNKTNT